MATALGEALTEVNGEIAALSTELDEVKRRNDRHIDATTAEQQISELAATARSRLDNPSLETIAALYDVLDLDLTRTGSDRFEGTGVIPIPENGGKVWGEGPSGGEVCEKVPQRGKRCRSGH